MQGQSIHTRYQMGGAGMTDPVLNVLAEIDAGFYRLINIVTESGREDSSEIIMDMMGIMGPFVSMAVSMGYTRNELLSAAMEIIKRGDQ